MTVVTDVHADGGVARLEDGVAAVSWLEEELLKEAGIHLRNVLLAILTKVSAISVIDGSGVVEDAAHLALIHRNDHHHGMLLSSVGNQVGGGAGDFFGSLVPARVLAGAEVWSVEDLLQAQNLHALLASVFDHGKVFVHHRLLNFLDGALLVVQRVAALDEAAADDLALGSHVVSLIFGAQ